MESLAEHLMEDSATIDPVAFGQANTGEIGIVFGIDAPLWGTSGTSGRTGGRTSRFINALWGRRPLWSAASLSEADRVIGRLVDGMGIALQHESSPQQRSRDGIVLMPKSTRLSVITANVAA